MSDFKYSVFMFESALLPDELKLMKGAAEALAALPESAETLVQLADNGDQAVAMIADFKVRHCGSAYSLGIINVNRCELRDIEFLLKPEVLGDPRVIFLASLKYMMGEVYALARAKIQRETEAREMATSCMDCYGAANRDQAQQRVALLAAAYLREGEEWVRARREGKTLGVPSHAGDLLRKSQTTFFGGAMKSGQWRSVTAGPPSALTTSGRFPKLNRNGDANKE
ncbi:MAG TPA: hypothetical protein VGP72_25380 [Planctomycetota bacterium]|jgi:hypothetical protein